MKRFFPTLMAKVMNARFRFVYSQGGKVVGSRALVVKEDKVLLVSHTYTDGWYTIGGLIEKGETPLNAIKRELVEEAGIFVNKDPKLIHVYHSLNAGKDDYIFFYWVDDFKEAQFSSFEIEEAKWFPLNQLPLDTTPGTRRRIEEFMGMRDITDHW